MSAEEAKWYIIHTQASYDFVVSESIRNMIENNGLQDYIYDVKVLYHEEMVEDAKGKQKKKIVKETPSYVYIKMIYTPQVWYYVTSIRGVTSFLGPRGRPLPLTNQEVKRMGLETIKIEEFNIKVGDSVTIISGALNGFTGTVDEINMETQKLKVSVSMFGHRTPVEVEFANVEKI